LPQSSARAWRRTRMQVKAITIPQKTTSKCAKCWNESERYTTGYCGYCHRTCIAPADCATGPCISLPPVHSCLSYNGIVGVQTVEHVKLLAAAMAVKLSAEEMDEIHGAAPSNPLLPNTFLFEGKYNTRLTVADQVHYQMATWIDAPPKQLVRIASYEVSRDNAEREQSYCMRPDPERNTEVWRNTGS
jgi:hypothetical protein